MSTTSAQLDIVRRLKRAHGHLAKVIEMLESGQAPLETAQQLQAVVNALSSAKTIHVQEHIQDRITTALEKSGKRATQEIETIMEIAKYL